MKWLDKSRLSQSIEMLVFNFMLPNHALLNSCLVSSNGWKLQTNVQRLYLLYSLLCDEMFIYRCEMHGCVIQEQP